MKKTNQTIAHELFERLRFETFDNFKNNKDYAALDKANQTIVCRIVNNLIRQEYY
jgi:predicted lipoprotein